MPSRQINDFFTKRKQKKIELVSRPGRVALHGEGGGGLDDEPGGGALPVYQDLLHPVLLHLELPQRAELGQAAQGKDELVPVGILLANLLPGWNKKRV